MNGIRFYRKKNKLAIYELSELSHVCKPTIHSLEEAINPTTALTIYLRLADALGVTLDELLDDYDPALLKDGDRHAYCGSAKHPRNPIAVYRREENLSFQQLATRMGVTSREWARRVCEEDTASPKLLRRLAAFENLTEAEFLRRYAVEGVCA